MRTIPVTLEQLISAVQQLPPNLVVRSPDRVENRDVLPKTDNGR
jgi:hypothetical protein